MKKFWKRLIIVLAIVLLLLIAAGIVAGNYFYELALDPTTNKSIVFQAPQNAVGSSPNSDEEDRQKANQDWLGEKGAIAMEMESYDGLALKAIGVLNEDATENWVVICHGYGGKGVQMVGSARTFYEKGYNILIPDARGCGNSEGNYIGMGWHERLDIVDWIEQINAAYNPTNVVLYGVSMGGATVMMVSGETLPENVRAIVEDCGYSSVWGEFAHQLNGVFGLPTFPIMNFASLVTKVRADFTLEEASAINQVSKSVTPILLSTAIAIPSYQVLWCMRYMQQPTVKRNSW